MFARHLLMLTLLVGVVSLTNTGAPADEAVAATESLTVGAMAEKVRPSMAVFQVADRDGQMKGVGTGFVVTPDGLIVTNLHVIGEGRKFDVELSDGREMKVVEIVAADRHLDLAVVRVAVDDDRPLTALELGEAGQLLPGAPIVVMGNPFGLRHSVVSGVLSARRDVEGRQMLQLAIPVEPGNSGSPVLDMQGRVQGIVTMKSAVSDNLGFAVDVADLRPMLDKPNPIPIERWLSLGALDEKQWQTRFGAIWKQRAGRISVEGVGEGFGGRSLCIYQQAPPELPYDVTVRVKLDDESGAAGLIFHADGEDRHYGFYPTGGRLRLTCFQGPSVFTWQILDDQPSQHYRPGMWNRLRVRVEKDKFICYVNDQQVFESNDVTFTTGKVGLAKFRETKAEFRGFELGRDVSTPLPSEEQLQSLAELIGSFPSAGEPSPEVLEELASLQPLSGLSLRDEANKLEQQAATLRQLADDVHLHSVIAELQSIVTADDFDLLRACLAVSRLDDEELDVPAYVHEVERMTDEIRMKLEEGSSEQARLEALDKYLFRENGFHGSRHEYYHRANSHIHRVIDDREGLPITLSVLYMELGARLGLKIEGVGLPGHFVVRFQPAEGEPQLIDVFESGKRLTRDHAAAIVQDYSLESLSDEHLQATTDKQILQRILHNLLNVAEQQQDAHSLRRYLEALVAIEPDSVQFRGMRAIARFQNGRKAAAIADLDWFLEHQPPGVDLDRIREMRAAFSGQ